MTEEITPLTVARHDREPHLVVGWVLTLGACLLTVFAVGLAGCIGYLAG